MSPFTLSCCIWMIHLIKIEISQTVLDLIIFFPLKGFQPPLRNFDSYFLRTKGDKHCKIMNAKMNGKIKSSPMTTLPMNLCNVHSSKFYFYNLQVDKISLYVLNIRKIFIQTINPKPFSLQQIFTKAKNVNLTFIFWIS